MQWDALRAMVREPDASARRLAAETFQSEQSFGVMAARMERNGLITRTAGLGRLRRHRPTEEGLHLLDLGNAVANEVFAATIGTLTPDERAVLLDLLTRAAAE
ncbi:hypothetical protein GCM10011512_24750 [Tersicoccus solisilvae]|uniref:HTH marR-type domain-containing protein n=1 Tax=Tersicoccus solisilvae TaxID=1882339 RepID=A0ABQ1PGN6_9MICC|nr:helix-turn-helix domain-containing protein [Tersicoccus solisilvae]GGC96777.1 hypothetical protein GCM10011512_24750 [Tersicoccus solisilvae]